MAKAKFVIWCNNDKAPEYGHNAKLVVIGVQQNAQQGYIVSVFGKTKTDIYMPAYVPVYLLKNFRIKNLTPDMVKHMMESKKFDSIAPVSHRRNDGNMIKVMRMLTDFRKKVYTLLEEETNKQEEARKTLVTEE